MKAGVHMRERKNINLEVGRNIQTAREQAGYTQDALSERMGITPNHLSAIERGVSGISLETLSRLCRLLGVSADRILFGSSVADADAQTILRDKALLEANRMERPFCLQGWKKSE